MLDLPQAERSLLARIGFFLCRDGDVPDAADIFSGLSVSAPEKDGPVIGLALCHVLAGQTDEALALLDPRLDAGGGMEEALTLYKLLALAMGGRTAEARALRGEMERKGMSAAVGTADQLLEELAERQVS